MLANIAVIAGHIGKPRSGIIVLKPGSNSQGFEDIGIEPDGTSMLKEVQDNKIKALVVFGEDVKTSELDGLEFLMVQDTHMTEAASIADVVLPAASAVESEGTYTSFERRLQKLNRAITPIVDRANWEVIMELCNAFGLKLKYGSTEEIFRDLCRQLPGYKGAFERLKDSGELFVPTNTAPVLYEGKFGFEDGKARLQRFVDAPMFMKKSSGDSLAVKLESRLQEQGIINK